MLSVTHPDLTAYRPVTSPGVADAKAVAAAFAHPAVMVTSARDAAHCPRTAHRAWAIYARLSNDPMLWVMTAACAWADNQFFRLLHALYRAVTIPGTDTRLLLRTWWALARVADTPQPATHSCARRHG